MNGAVLLPCPGGWAAQKNGCQNFSACNAPLQLEIVDLAGAHVLFHVAILHTEYRAGQHGGLQAERSVHTCWRSVADVLLL